MTEAAWWILGYWIVAGTVCCSIIAWDNPSSDYYDNLGWKLLLFGGAMIPIYLAIVLPANGIRFLVIKIKSKRKG